MASLAPISNLTVPAQQGYTVPLDGSGTTDAQTFTVTSSNPDIAANIVSGPFWTVDVQYTDPSNSANDFSGPLVFQLFNSAGSTTLTPNTVSMITEFTNDGYYTNTGKYITRVQSGFPNSDDWVVQGGAPNPDGTGNSGQPGTPFANESVQQLAFTGNDQLAMANAGGTNSNDTQFFITSLADPATANPNSVLGYGYTIFGQMIPNPTSSSVPSDQTTLTKLTQIPTSTNPSTGLSQPVNNPIFTSVTLSNTNPSGTLLLDTTQAKAGETSTITVTATDPTTGTSTTQTFNVTVGAYGGPTGSSSNPPPINFRPYATAATVSAQQGQASTITLSGTSGYPSTTSSSTLSYSLVSQPAHGTVTNFNPSTGTLTYTPNPGFSGTDSLQFEVNATGPESTPAVTTSNPATITINVSPTPPVDTGAVRVVGTVLLVTPLPKAGRHVRNTIDVIQTTPSGDTTPVIEVFVNGQLDINQPSIDTIDSIDVFGSKGSDRITIDPSVTIPSLIDGGHGGHNVLIGGGSETREHGWFGTNKMIGGSGPNQLIGRTGHVKFRPSSSTDLIFAGKAGHPPTGTFYVYKKGRVIPVPLSSLYPSTSTTTTTTPVVYSGTHHKKK